MKRSCHECHRRKVKCDKATPCSACAGAGEVCRYPQAPIRRFRASQRPAALYAGISRKDADKPDDNKAAARGPGRVLSDGSGKTRFISLDFWARVEDESQLQCLLEEHPPDQRLDSANSVLSANIIFDGRPQDQVSLPDARVDPYLWSPDHIIPCWSLFKTNVDPMVRILHKPSMEQLIHAATRSGLLTMPLETVALVVAICYTAVATLDPAHFAHSFEGDRDLVLRHHEYAVELALSRARWIRSSHIHALQAFVLVLSCMPRESNRSIWTLTGLALRIAVSIGLHLGNTGTQLNAFETEMRARLWWQLNLLDVRLSEDHGTDGSAMGATARVPLPLNVNDADWDVNAPQPPQVRQGFTEMTFSLLRFEACRVTWLYKDRFRCATKEENGFEEQETFVRRFASVMHTKYLRFLDEDSGPQTPLMRFCVLTVRTFMDKLRLKAHFPTLVALFSRTGARAAVDPAVNEDLFERAVRVLQSGQGFSQESDLAPFFWVRDQYVQWHAMAFVLAHLYTNLCGPTTSPVAVSPDSVDCALAAVEWCLDQDHVRDDRYKLLRRMYTRITGQRGSTESTQADHTVSNTVSAETSQDLESLMFMDLPFTDWETVLDDFGFIGADENLTGEEGFFSTLS